MVWEVSHALPGGWSLTEVERDKCPGSQLRARGPFHRRAANMSQPSEAKRLSELTAVPAGWPLATVIDAFLDLARYRPISANADRAREVVSTRLVELWASQPQEAEAWLQRCRERYAKELAGKETRPEQLFEALLRHGAAEHGKYESGFWLFSEAGLLRGESWGSAAEREYWAAGYLQCPHVRDRCRELAERLVAAESQETARKRQKLEEETSERGASKRTSKHRRRRRAESSAIAWLRRRQRSGAKSSQLAQQVRRQLQEEHSQCQERCEELLTRLEAEAAEHATTKERLSQAASDAAERRMEAERLLEESRSYHERCRQAEAERLQEESRSYQERCRQAEVARLASAQDPGSNAELQLEKAVLQDRCEQLQQQLTKAEADRSAMLGQLLDLREEHGMHKERIRELEKQLLQAKKSHHLNSDHTPHCEAPVDEASNSQEPDLAERLGYSFVDDDGTASSVLSHSSWFSVKPDSVKPQCFMVDAIFKTRSFGADFFLMGRDLKKGSQVVAGDDASILEVAKTPEICDASEVVELQAGTATLRVTPDHLVQVADAKAEESLYLAAGKLKAGDLVMLDSGEVAALSSVVLRREACQVLKIVFEP
ncbi:unnamed protein product [Symbiodinium sp. CCMP2456]|nr:unnamed protein product [Symbiodinium sp. CCMP2456]